MICKSGVDVQSTSSSKATQMLAMTIKKKRAVLGRKDRDLRVEILLSSTIRRLCQEIGDWLHQSRSQKRQRSPNDYDADDEQTKERSVKKRSRRDSQVVVSGSGGQRSELALAVVDQRIAADDVPHDPAVLNQSDSKDSRCREKLLKRKSDESEETSKFPGYNESDPFGLSELFDSLQSSKKKAKTS